MTTDCFLAPTFDTYGKVLTCVIVWNFAQSFFNSTAKWWPVLSDLCLAIVASSKVVTDAVSSACFWLLVVDSHVDTDGV